MPRPRQSGFSLIEILVVITIIAALVGLATPIIQNALDKSRVVTCSAHLSDIGKEMFVWKGRHKDHWPRESGIRFLLVLHKDGMVEGKDCAVFLCPGTEDINWTKENRDPGSTYQDWDDIDPMTISYAGRDGKNFSINKNKENKEVIAADDNDGRNNHKFTTNFLYADGSVASYDINADVIDAGIELDGLDYIPVGPDSPMELLQKLQLD
ncbi:MAG: type II secretion system protein [Planctomycetota bacterium]